MANAEALYLSALLRSGDPSALTAHNITINLFSTHKDAITWVVRYVSKYGRLPSVSTFKVKFPNVSLRQVDDTDTAAEDLKHDYARRSMTSIIDQAIVQLDNGDIAKGINQLGDEILRLQASMVDKAEDFDLAESWEKVYEEVQNRILRVSERGSAGVPTGFQTLDNITGGMQGGWYSVVAARMGKGKTWTTVKMAVSAVLAGYTALYFTLEQPPNQIAMRSHSLLSKELKNKKIFNNMDLSRGTGFDVREYKEFLINLPSMIPGKFVLEGAQRGRVTPMVVAGAIERVQPDIVYIDYLTLMGVTGDGGWMSWAGLSADLQQLSQRYNVPIVAGSQQNQTGNLSRSDSVGMDVDLRLDLDQKSTHVITHEIVKFRHGTGGGKYFCHFDPGKGIYEEVSGDRGREIMDADCDSE